MATLIIDTIANLKLAMAMHGNALHRDTIDLATNLKKINLGSQCVRITEALNFKIFWFSIFLCRVLPFLSYSLRVKIIF